MVCSLLPHCPVFVPCILQDFGGTYGCNYTLVRMWAHMGRHTKTHGRGCLLRFFLALRE